MTNQDIDIDGVTAVSSDRLCGDDLLGGGRNIRITDVSSFSDEKGKLRATLRYEGDGGKPYIPTKTCSRILVAVWGKHTSAWVGKTMTVYRDPEITFGGAKVGGVFISHASDIKETLKLMLTTKRGKKETFTIRPLQAERAPQRQEQPEQPEHDAATGELPPIDKAAAWADTTLAAIATTADRAALAELQQASQKALAKLSAQRPELSELVSMAFVERVGAFDEPAELVELADDEAPF